MIKMFGSSIRFPYVNKYALYWVLTNFKTVRGLKVGPRNLIARQFLFVFILYYIALIVSLISIEAILMLLVQNMERQTYSYKTAFK